MTDQPHHDHEGLIRVGEHLRTPIYLKLQQDAAWPKDAVFFLLSGEGLHLCRNHDLFRSSVPAPNFPAELAPHEPFLALRYPVIPRRLVERAVGFFHEVYRRWGAEAGLLLVLDDATRQLRLTCPRQVASISRGIAGTLPLNLRYQIPPLEPGELLIGDLHSHANEPAYASGTDRADEVNRTGLHVVVGRLGAVDRGETPAFHVDAVADGMRFSVQPRMVMEQYRRPGDDYPVWWLDRVEVEVSSWTSSSDAGWDASGSGNGWRWSGDAGRFGPCSDDREEGER
jgi:PRTRC genetic system protein A